MYSPSLKPLTAEELVSQGGFFFLFFPTKQIQALLFSSVFTNILVISPP